MFASKLITEIQKIIDEKGDCSMWLAFYNNNQLIELNDDIEIEFPEENINNIILKVKKE